MKIKLRAAHSAAAIPISRLKRFRPYLAAFAMFLFIALINFTAAAQNADPAALLNQARVFVSQQRYAEASQTYLQITTQYASSPLSFDAWQELGNVYDVQSRFDEAAAAYEKLYGAAPDGPIAPQALFSRARILTKAGRQNDAAEALKLLLRKFPDNSLANQAAIQLAALLIPAGKYNDAAGALKKVLNSKSAPETQQALDMLADLYVKSGQWYEAENALKKLIAAQPGNEYYARQLANALTKQKEFGKALDVYRELAAKHPGDQTYESDVFAATDRAGLLDGEIEELESQAGKKTGKLDAAKKLVRIYLWKKSSLDALRLLENIAAQQPLASADSITLARLYFENQYKTKAAETLLEVLKTDIGNYQAWQLLGDIKHAAGAGDEAHAAWEKSVGFNAGDVSSYQRLGQLYSDKNMLAESAAVYEKARAAFKNGSLFTIELLFLYRAQMRPLDQLNEYLRALASGMPPPFSPVETLQAVEGEDTRAGAIKKIETWQAATPDNRLILQLYALAGFEIGDPANAVTALDEYSRRNPAQPDIFLETARAMLDAGKYEPAAEIYNAAAARAQTPEQKSTPLMGAARAYIWNNQPEKAAAVLKQVIADGAASPDLPDALFQLAEIQSGAGDCGAALPLYTRLDDQFAAGVYSAKAAMGRARCLIATGSFSDAEKILEDLWNRPAASPYFDEMMYLQGEAKFLQGMFKEAQPLYKRIAESWPESRFVNDALSRLLFINDISGMDTILAQTFMSAIKVRASGDPGQAATLFEGMRVTMAKTPLAPYVEYELARTRAAQGRLDEAISIFLKLAQTPNETELPSLAVIEAAAAQIKLGRLQDALHTYQILLDSNPSSFWADYAREKVQQLSSTLAPGS